MGKFSITIYSGQGKVVEREFTFIEFLPKDYSNNEDFYVDKVYNVSEYENNLDDFFNAMDDIFLCKKDIGYVNFGSINTGTELKTKYFQDSVTFDMTQIVGIGFAYNE